MRIRAALAVLALAIAGCTQQVSGAQHAIAPSTNDSPTQPPTTPATPGPAPTIPTAAAIIESHRMGPYVVQIDKLLKGAVLSCIPSGPYPTPDAAGGIVFGLETSRLLTLGGYVGGWYGCFNLGSGERRIGGNVGLLESSDPSRAATLITTLALGSVHPGAKAVTLPGLPQATVVQYPGYNHEPVIAAFFRTGRMISYAWGGANGGTARLPAVRSMVAKVLRAQAAEARRFHPTPVDKLSGLDDDPALLDGRVVQPAGDPSWYAGGYSLATYPALADDPNEEIPLLRRNGFRELYLKDGSSAKGTEEVWLSVYRSPAAARRVLAGEIPIVRSHYPNPRKVKVRGVKDAYCIAFKRSGESGPHQECLFAAKKYTVQADVVGLPKSLTDTSAMRTLIGKQLAFTPQ